MTGPGLRTQIHDHSVCMCGLVLSDRNPLFLRKPFLHGKRLPPSPCPAADPGEGTISALVHGLAVSTSLLFRRWLETVVSGADYVDMEEGFAMQVARVHFRA